MNATAQSVAQTPFQAYSSNPNAFVAPLTATQQSGIANTNAYSQAAQPAIQQGQQATQAGLTPALQMTEAGSQAANPTAIGASQINQYLSPYLGDVLGSTEALQNQSNQQQQAGQLGSAITSGAFGGDRAGVAAANLEEQQNLANNATIANIANTGFNTALSTAQQQQGVDLSAQQANLARLQAGGAQISNISNTTGQQEASLGEQAQTAGLAGAQAQMTAGQAQQQTQQAGLTALYNQFLQQQSYPFQTTQFLANIAEGTGALSGSTTSTTQPAPFFSDERLKEDIEPIGKTFEGQNIIRFRYKGDKNTQIGLSAQETEKKHPEAVGLAGGFKTVDYKGATDKAAGLAGGRKHRDDGGYLEAQEQGYDAAGLAPPAGLVPYGGQSPAGNGAAAHTRVPQTQAGQHQMLQPTRSVGPQQQSGLSQINQLAQTGNSLEDIGSFGKKAVGLVAPAQDTMTGAQPQSASGAGSPPPASVPASDPSVSGLGAQGMPAPQQDPSTSGGLWDALSGWFGNGQNRGGFIARRHRDAGGVIPYESADSSDDNIDIPQQGATTQQLESEQKGMEGQSGGSGSSGGGFNPLSAVGPLLGLLSLKQGGLAGRHGYATDGSVDDNGNPIPDNLIDTNAEENPIPLISHAPPPAPAPVVDDTTPAPVHDPRDEGFMGGLGGYGKNMDWNSDADRLTHDVWNNPGLQYPFASEIEDMNKNNAGRGLAPDYKEQIASADNATPPASIPMGEPGRGAGPATDVSAGLGTPMPPIPPAGFGSAQSAPAEAPDETKKEAQSASAEAPEKPAGGKEEASPSAPQPNGNGGAGGLAASNQPEQKYGLPAKENEGEGGMFSGLSKAFKDNQHLLVPLMAGLGQMASSNSRYFGSALLQGLGAAGQSYENVLNEEAGRNAENANTGHVGAATNATEMGTARQALGPAASKYVTGTDANGNLISKSFLNMIGDNGDMANIPGPQGRGNPANNSAAPTITGGQAQGAPAGVTAPVAAAAAATADKVAPQRIASFTDPDPADVQNVLSTVKRGYAFNNPVSGPDYYTANLDKANEALDRRSYLVPLSRGLHALTQETGGTDLPAIEKALTTPGPLQQYFSPLVDKVNAAAQAAGVNVGNITPAMLANKEEVEKLNTQFAAATAANGHQASNDSFSKLTHTIPGIMTSPAGQGKLFGQLFAGTQRDLDKNDYEQKFFQATRGGGTFDPYARAASQTVENLANNKFNSTRVASDADAIEKIYNAPSIVSADGKTKLSLWDALMTGQAPPKYAKQLEAQHPGIMRMFTGQQQ